MAGSWGDSSPSPLLLFKADLKKNNIYIFFKAELEDYWIISDNADNRFKITKSDIADNGMWLAKSGNTDKGFKINQSEKAKGRF